MMLNLMTNIALIFIIVWIDLSTSSQNKNISSQPTYAADVGQQPAKVANTANSFYLRERLTLFKKFFGLIIRGNHTLGILFGQEMFITSSNKAKTYCTKDFGCFSSWRKCLQCWWATSRGRLSLFFVTWKESKHLTICQTGSAT